MNKRPKILVVDDEERNLRLIEAFLIPENMDILFALNGKEALHKVEEDPPDVILLDVMMPGMSGFEVAKKLKESNKTSIIPVVIVTALAGLEDRVKALEAGADDFLSKPIDRTELKARIRSLLKVKKYNDHMLNYQSKLESEVRLRTEELRQVLKDREKSSLETIIRLSKAAEYKDDDTGSHVARMSYYAAEIAEKVGLNPTFIKIILHSAPMHDVGKIGIPDSILLKPGKLEPDEWEKMKLHTVFGKKILEGSDSAIIQVAETIAYTHHEKWDGSGYPEGLKGYSIPLVGRIVAVADVFDALTTKRPYKEPFSVEKSLNIIREGRGSHFDPKIVDIFFSIEDKILKIKDSYQGDHELANPYNFNDIGDNPCENIKHRNRYIIWTDGFYIGDEKLDEQHKRIFSILNKLQSSQANQDDLDQLLPQLQKITAAHLHDEEKCLKEIDFYNRENHVKAHRILEEKTNQFITHASEDEQKDLSCELFNFIKNWWTHHILVMDQEYVPYLKSNHL